MLLAWGFGALIAGGLLAAALSVAVWRLADTALEEYERQDTQIALNASRGVDAWLKVRRYEEQFMLASGGAAGAADARARFIPLWQTNLDDIRRYLVQIRRIGDESDRKVLDLLPPLETSLSRYAANFLSAADGMIRLGGDGTKLGAELNAAARSTEIAVANKGAPTLEQSLVRLNRIRAEFAQTGGDHAVRDFTDEADNFERLAGRSVRPRAMLDAEHEFRTLFAEFVGTARKVETGRRDFLAAAAVIESGLEELEHEALQNTQRTLKVLEGRIGGVTRSAALIALAAVLLGTVVAAFVAGRIRVAAQRVIGFAARVAAGRLETRLAGVDRGEFGALESALNTMADRLQEGDEIMNRQARHLEQSSRRIALLSEMTGLLQTAVGLDEAASITSGHLEQMRLGNGGGLYLYNASRNHLGIIARWGSAPVADGFAPDDCWALRRGQPYGSAEGHSALICAHAKHAGADPSYLCLPMVSPGGMLGLIHVAFGDGGAAGAEEESRFARRLSEQLGLALANLKLRETLREQSLSDPLTGLFNRRFLEESVNREFARAERGKQSLAVLMIDADHFKRYNDVHGHEAGDTALRQLGRVLKENCRAADLVCRYGGEEFTAVLPNTSTQGAQMWADRLLDKVRQMEITWRGIALPPLTVSIGGALYPEHGDSAEAIIQAADLALYEAKRLGRDRLVVKAP